jgi:hypothetical protein
MEISALQVPPLPRVSRRAAPVLLALAGLLWVSALAGGFTLVWKYKSTPGDAQERPPSRWPAASRMARAPGRHTLVMFVHPHCPCTRASVAELGRLMSRLGETVSARVRVLRPKEASTEWDHTSVWDRAAAVPSVMVEADEDGQDAALFNAVTSGQTLLYDGAGQLLFSGGLTSARGHEGDSFGHRRILALVTSGKADRTDSPIFGCSLIGPAHQVKRLTPQSRKDGTHEHN